MSTYSDFSQLPGSRARLQVYSQIGVVIRLPDVDREKDDGGTRPMRRDQLPPRQATYVTHIGGVAPNREACAIHSPFPGSGPVCSPT